MAATAGFAVLGSYSAVAPSFLSTILEIHNHAVAGGLVATLFFFSAVSQLASRRLRTARALAAGCALLALGMVVLVVSLMLQSLGVLVAATVVIGVGQGLSFSKGLESIVEASPAGRASEAVSAYFAVAYLAISFPVVAQGVAAAAWGVYPAALVLNVTVAVLALAALASTVWAYRRATPAG